MSDLITRLEEAAEGSPELSAEIGKALGVVLAGIGNDGVWGVKEARWTQSIDAALALAERLHPCWSWSVGQNVHHKYWRAYALALDTDRAAFQPTEATSKTPALALCLAILKANHKDKP